MNTPMYNTPWPRKRFHDPFQRMLLLNRQELMVFFAHPIGPSNRVAWKQKLGE